MADTQGGRIIIDPTDFLTSLRAAPARIAHIAIGPHSASDLCAFDAFAQFAILNPRPTSLIVLFDHLKMHQEHDIREGSVLALIHDTVRQTLQIFNNELKKCDGLPAGGVAEGIAKLCLVLDLKEKVRLLTRVNEELKAKEVELDEREKRAGSVVGGEKQAQESSNVS